nr:MAG TPA: hypothetical protein [Caudoviricetes sp.]
MTIVILADIIALEYVLKVLRAIPHVILHIHPFGWCFAPASINNARLPR